MRAFQLDCHLSAMLELHHQTAPTTAALDTIDWTLLCPDSANRDYLLLERVAPLVLGLSHVDFRDRQTLVQARPVQRSTNKTLLRLSKYKVLIINQETAKAAGWAKSRVVLEFKHSHIRVVCILEFVQRNDG